MATKKVTSATKKTETVNKTAAVTTASADMAAVKAETVKPAAAKEPVKQLSLIHI